MAMPNSRLTVHSNISSMHRGYPGTDLRWPASAVWRSDEPEVRTISFADLRNALSKGIDDFLDMPSHAIFLCVIYPLIGLILSRLLFGYEMLPLIYPIAAGFTLMGPVAAIGLYELSRRRELGLKSTAGNAFDVFKSPSIGAIIRLSLLLGAIFVGWLLIAYAIYAQLFGDTTPTSIGTFLQQIFDTPEGHQLILVGNAIGAAFAVLVLTISVISFPMLVDRNVPAMTAVRTSIRAVLANPLTMAAWGLIVVAALVIGSLPLFVGLAVVVPVLGHATWHLYRRVVER
jgi:uncharacterized membrane protein